MVHENPAIELGSPHLPFFGNNGATTSTFGLLSAPATAMLFWQSDHSQALVKHIPAWEPYTNNSQNVANASAHYQNAYTLIRKDDPQAAKKANLSLRFTGYCCNADRCALALSLWSAIYI